MTESEYEDLMFHSFDEQQEYEDTPQQTEIDYSAYWFINFDDQEEVE